MQVYLPFCQHFSRGGIEGPSQRCYVCLVFKNITYWHTNQCTHVYLECTVLSTFLHCVLLTHPLHSQEFILLHNEFWLYQSTYVLQPVGKYGFSRQKDGTIGFENCKVEGDCCQSLLIDSAFFQASLWDSCGFYLTYNTRVTNQIDMIIYITGKWWWVVLW